MKNEHFLRYFNTAALVGLFLISFTAFTRETKEEAIRQRGHKCQRCGKTNADLHAHHILPEQMGGSDNLDNLFLVCERCHPVLDGDAIRHGQLANGLTVQDVATDMPELIGNNDRYQKAARRFSKRRR
jgi:predicted restriction endonuclease